jgi:tRNA uridine 5-carboxymethylaminomethyl modification enzyme
LGIKNQTANDALYSQYLVRQTTDIEAVQREEGHEIPAAFDYTQIAGLSNELKQKLSRAQPLSLAQAGRIEGMTPAALTLILAFLRRFERSRAAI